MPSFDEERQLENRGFRFIAGVDEAGRGALAGPVVAAAVILPLGKEISFIGEVRDSKKLTPRKRDTLFDLIRDTALCFSVGIVEYDVIDDIGILPSTKLAMKLAIEQLTPAADSLLVDYVKLPEIPLPQRNITKGDDLSYSIACASIVAKVTRDRIMVKLDESCSGYGLAEHKGYGTGAHLECLYRLGPSPVHRRTFGPVRDRLL